MATLTPTLKLESTDATSDSAFSLSLTDELSVGQPQLGLSRKAAEASSGSTVELIPTGSVTKYVYIRHTGKQSDGSTSTTQALNVYFNSEFSLSIKAEEFAFIPVRSTATVNAIGSSTHTIQVEYAYWSAA
tara:strand:+ start:111 stop:503 length:393 start_codon:yes stop_codon:yes gene_type:complete